MRSRVCSTSGYVGTGSASKRRQGVGFVDSERCCIGLDHVPRSKQLDRVEKKVADHRAYFLSNEK